MASENCPGDGGVFLFFDLWSNQMDSIHDFDYQEKEKTMLTLHIRSGGAIWPLIVVHALYGFLGKLGHGCGAQAQPTSSFEVLVRLVLAVLVGIYGIWLVRRKTLAIPLVEATG